MQFLWNVRGWNKLQCRFQRLLAEVENEHKDEQNWAAFQSFTSWPLVCFGKVAKSHCAFIVVPQVLESFDCMTSNSYPITETDNSAMFNMWHCRIWNRPFKWACININLLSSSYKHARLRYSTSPKKPPNFASVQHAMLYQQFCILQLLRHSAFNITQKINK